MRKLAFLFSIVTGILYSQTSDEKLIKKYNTYKKQDTIRCNILLKLIESGDANETLQIYNDELLLITSNNITKQTNKNLKKYYELKYADALYNASYFVTLKNQHKKAIQLVTKALKYHIKFKKQEEICAGYNLLAMNHQEIGNEELAINYYQESIEAGEKGTNTEYLLNALHDLSILYSYQYQFKDAIDLQFRILQISEKTKKKLYIADCLITIGAFYYDLNEIDKTEYFIIKGLKIQQEINNKNGIALAYFHLGNVAQFKKKYNLALNYFFKSTLLENGISRFKTYAKIGQVYRQKRDHKNALFYLLKVKSIVELNENQDFIPRLYIELARVYLDTKQLNNSEKYAKEALTIAKKIKQLSQVLDCYKLLSEIESKRKNHKRAFDFFYRSTQIQDSIHKIDNKNAMLKAEFKYETEKKEAQIKALSQQKKIATLESERQKTIALVLAIAIISILIISYFLFNKYKIKKQNELLKSQLDEAQKTIEAEKKATESELKALKSQMNPHFIFNALSGIQDQFMYGDKAIANEQMGNFTYLTRQILSVSGKKQILLSTEIEILTKYLELEKMRFKTDFEYQINLSETIDEDYHEIPPMLIQPFVENSIKHGLLHKSGLKKVSIHFELDPNEEYIICTIEDNGIGRAKSGEIKANSSIKHTSFSTQSIEDRLLLLNEKLHLEKLISYEDIIDNKEVVGTKVVLNIPLI